MSVKYVCFDIATNGTFLYVSHLPGDGGKDWGYVYHAAGARPLTRQQAMRWSRETGNTIPALYEETKHNLRVNKK